MGQTRDHHPELLAAVFAATTASSLAHCEWRTATLFSSSAVPGLLVGLDLKAVHQLVEAAEQIDDGHQLEDSFVVQSQLPHRGSVNL
jgi:hypothetical protein